MRLASATQIRLRNGKIALGAAGGGGGGDLTAGTGVTINDVSDYTLYQRVGTSKTVNLSGTCTGSPSRIEWRKVDWLTGLPTSDWATLIDSPPESWTADVEYPESSVWERVEIRDAVDTALTHSTINRMGVGAYIALIGQSNTVGFRSANGSLYPNGSRSAIEYKSSLGKIRIGKIADGFPPNTPYSTHATLTQAAGTGDGYIYLANQLTANLGVLVCLVEVAVIGSSIELWMTGGSAWNGLVTAMTALGGDAEMAFMLQGESDAAGMTYGTRLTKLGTLHGQLKTLFGRTDANFKFFIATLGSGSFGGSTEGQFGKIRAADAHYANNTAGAYLATCGHDAYTSDGVHWVHQSASLLGRRTAKSISAAYGVGTTGAGPKITSASRSGTAVTVSIAHTGGTTLQDCAGGTGTGATGFQFFDAGAGGAEIGYTSSGLSGNTLVLTLASTPVGALTMSYAMMNNPHNATTPDANYSKNPPVLASIICDNATYLNSGTVGCPLQPCAAITIT